MRIDFTAENKSKGNARYPKLALEKGETARVALLEAPLLKYVHVLKMPIVDPATGEQMKVEAKNAKGEVYEKDADEFVAQMVCTGDLSVVRENEVDPANCPACKDVVEHADKFKAPDAKYVAHAIKYKVQPGTVQPQNPFQVELTLWVMTQNKFDKVINISTEFGDPRTIDLQLGPCNNATFQNYEMAACNGQAVWMQQESNKQFVGQLMTANAADEETMANTIAQPLSPTRYGADAAKVIERCGMLGRPQGQTPANMEFGGIAQASNQMAQQADQPAPWSTQGAPSWAQPQAEPQQAPVAQQAAPAQQWGPPQEQAPQQFQPQQGGQGGPPSYDTPPQFPGAPQQQAPQQFQPQQQAAPAQQWGPPQGQPQQEQAPQQFQPQQEQQAPQQQAAPAQQGGATFDFNALMAGMNNPPQG